MRFLLSFFKSPQTGRAHRLYTAVVGVARDPRYYSDFAVPDEFDNRFDMIVLHLWMLDTALAKNEETELSVRTQEIFIKDMDRNLREMGVGDLSVGKQIKAMGAALLGRFQAYRDAWENDTPETAMSAALWRNVYRAEEGKPSDACTALARLILEKSADWCDRADYIARHGPTR